jgi:hypothetical protein
MRCVSVSIFGFSAWLLLGLPARCVRNSLWRPRYNQIWPNTLNRAQLIIIPRVSAMYCHTWCANQVKKSSALEEGMFHWRRRISIIMQTCLYDVWATGQDWVLSVSCIRLENYCLSDNRTRLRGDSFAVLPSRDLPSISSRRQLASGNRAWQVVSETSFPRHGRRASSTSFDASYRRWPNSRGGAITDDLW